MGKNKLARQCAIAGAASSLTWARKGQCLHSTDEAMTALSHLIISLQFFYIFKLKVQWGMLTLEFPKLLF